MLKEQLGKLANEKNSPCVTISLNTHRTHPDNAGDVVRLKNLLKEAEEKIVAEYGKRSVAALLENIESLSSEIDVNYNLDSLHIFLSNDTKEIIKSAWPASHEGVYMSDRFALRSVIKSYNRNESYMVVVLSQSGVHVYEALNDTILREIRNEDFPFSENRHYTTHSDKGSDSKHADNLVREFLNKVDKALVKVHHATGLKCVVIATEENFSKLRQVADKPSVYVGFSHIDYNNTDAHHIARQSWDIIKSRQEEDRGEAIKEIKEAVAQGNVLTDLQEIFQASLDGRADLLIVHQDFSQSVIMTSERTFELTDDKTRHHVIDDITSIIAWEVISRNGRVIFTTQEEIRDIGNIVLKTRY